MKKLERVIAADHLQMGRTQVKQPLPAKGLRQLSPFVLLHHFGPTAVDAGVDPLDVGPHPHRGFQPVTILFQGAIQHRDSLGNEGVIRAGDVQWITAGSGLVHSEYAAPEFLEKGGTMEGIQLWVNLPQSHKMMTPTYQEHYDGDFPKISAGMAEIELICGSYSGQSGPVESPTDALVAKGRASAGQSLQLHIPDGHTLGIYVLHGCLQEADGKEVPAEHLGAFSPQGEEIRLHAQGDSVFLVLSGKPLGEPLVQYGPFVMNRPEEIQRAIQDYQSGKMGELSPA